MPRAKLTTRPPKYRLRVKFAEKIILKGEGGTQHNGAVFNGSGSDARRKSLEATGVPDKIIEKRYGGPNPELPRAVAEVIEDMPIVLRCPPSVTLLSFANEFLGEFCPEAIRSSSAQAWLSSAFRSAS